MGDFCEGKPRFEIHKKRDGLLLIDDLRGCRFLNWRESLAYRLFGRMPKP
jgi:hypothetical protein